ncbi:MAG: WG repeat-containing protein, partial [Prevotellaceae bacterium]|nr:WG repeat-containing protein [Prevotellaceae bacterium]
MKHAITLALLLCLAATAQAQSAPPHEYLSVSPPSAEGICVVSWEELSATPERRQKVGSEGDTLIYLPKTLYGYYDLRSCREFGRSTREVYPFSDGVAVAFLEVDGCYGGDITYLIYPGSIPLNLASNCAYVSGLRYDNSGHQFHNRRLWVGRYDFYGERYKDHRYGYIDPAGNEVIPTRYLCTGSFYNGCAAVQDTGYRWMLVDTAGQRMSVHQYDRVGFTKQDAEDDYEMHPRFAGGLLPVQRGGKWGYVNSYAQEVTPYLYDLVGYLPIGSRSAYYHGFSQGLTPVQRGGKWGFIDTLGREAIPPQFD